MSEVCSGEQTFTRLRTGFRTDSPGRPPRLSQLLNYGTQRAWNAYYIGKNGKEAERQPIKTPISAMTVSSTNHSRRETWRPLAGSLQRYEKQAKVWSSAGEGGGGEDGDGLGDVGEGRGHGDQVRRVSRHLFLFFLVEWPLLVDRLGCLLGKHACLDGAQITHFSLNDLCSQRRKDNVTAMHSSAGLWHT